MVLYYISNKNHIIFIYQFVDLIRLARPTNRRQGLITPQRLRTECCTNVTWWSVDTTRDVKTRAYRLEQISQALVKYFLTRFCESCQSPHMTWETNLLTWEESVREGLSEPISVRTVMSIINCRGDSSDRHEHCQYFIYIWHKACKLVPPMIPTYPHILLHHTSIWMV